MRRLLFKICILAAICHMPYAIWQALAQDSTLEFTVDTAANTILLPKIFKPNIDLSGRGSGRDTSRPQALAADEVLSAWEKEIGFGSAYRLQFDLWEIEALNKDKAEQAKLLENYENIIKKINDAGGIVILNIFGTPAGLGNVLDKTSAPIKLKAFKELIKQHIRNLSCNKKYNIWYEVWSAPDIDNFFLGSRQGYFNLYRQVAESIEELKKEAKIHIPLGGPGVSWWYQNIEGNTVITPEKSLIYELIKFCSRYRLPLDFISWHAYSTDPHAEAETTRYNKTAVPLIRDWLSYFNFDRNMPLMVSEWNYDSGYNALSERGEESYIASSYILSRLKNMHAAGLDYQFYFSLEDFQNNKEGIDRNTGIFWFNGEQGGRKSLYNIFRMLGLLGNNMFAADTKVNDPFTGLIATRGQDYLSILIYNYIDPDMAMNYLSRSIASLNDAERKAMINLAKADKLGKIIDRQIDIGGLRLRGHKLKTALKKAQELAEEAKNYQSTERKVKLSIKNLKEDYLYQRYVIDSACSLNCEFVPVEEKEISPTELYQEELGLKPYSVNLIRLKVKPKEVIQDAQG